MSARARAPLEVAARFGMRVEGAAASGAFEGRPAAVRVYAYDGSHGVRVIAPIVPALDLGLELRHHMLSPVIVVDGVDDPELDAEFSVHADENARARALFDDALCAHVVSANRASLEIRLRDDACTIDALEPLSRLEERWTEAALRTATRATALIDAVRPGLPAPRQLRDHAAAAARYAAARGLALEAAPLRLSGQVDGLRVEVTSARIAPNLHALTASVTFAEPLRLGLTLRRRHIVDDVRALFGGADVPLDDHRFHRRFFVHVEESHRGRAAALLPADIRAALLALDARFGEVHIDDAGVRVGGIPPGDEAQALGELLDALVDLGARLPRAARGEGAGPYR